MSPVAATVRHPARHAVSAKREQNRRINGLAFDYSRLACLFSMDEEVIPEFFLQHDADDVCQNQKGLFK